VSRHRPTLAILTHWTDRFWNERPLVQLMIPHWEAMGVKVLVLTDRQPFVPADVALLHVDLTVVPDSCRRLAERYPVVLNGGVVDIRKRRFSSVMVNRDTKYAGPVIVKTDLNYGGKRELRRRAMEIGIGRWLVKKCGEERVLRRLMSLEVQKPNRWLRYLPVGSYHVFDDAKQVPRGVWGNANLLVERFLAERSGGDYCCRHWLFFGQEEVSRMSISRDPVVKANARVEPISDSVPEELRKIRSQLGFDYGKFDYGIVDNEVVLYDANRTPGTTANAELHAKTVAVLSEGLGGFLPCKR
jgi:hypothetical protein